MSLKTKHLLRLNAYFLTVLLASNNIYAVSATWSATPGTADYNTDANWVGGVTPGGSSSNNDVATFNTSTIKTLTFSAGTSIGTWSVNSGSYNFNVGGQSVDFYNGGIVSNSNNPTVTTSTGSTINFHNSSTCANTTFQMSGGTVTFSDSSTADNTTVLNLNTASTVNVNAPITIGKIVAGGGSSGSVINVGSNFTIGDSSNFTYNGTLSGSGTITKTGSGTLTFPNTSGAGVNYIISQGSISVGNGGSTGSILGTIQNDSNLIFNHNASYGQNTVISGSGTVTFNASATTNMSAANSYSGGSTILRGIVAINNTTALGSGAVTVSGNSNIQVGGSASSFANAISIDNGITLTFQGSNNFTVNGIISGSGNITKTGTSTVTLAGANTNNGTITISQGAIQGTTSSLTTTIVNNASLIFNQSSDGTYSLGITGTGSLTKSGTGTVTLSGTNSYSGGTTVSAGTLLGDTNSLQGSITNNANVTFNMTAFSGTYAGTMGGTGTVTYTSTGNNTVSMTGNNSYSGGSIMNAGQMTLGSDTCLGTGAVSVTNDSTINVSTSGTRILPNNISISSGKNLTLAGSQFLTLNGTISGSGTITNTSLKTTFAGTNTSFSGGITLNSGTIFVANNSGLGTGTVTVAGNGAITATASTFTVNNNFTINNTRTLTFGGANNLTLAGNISGQGGLTLSADAASVTLVLSGTNTYSGTTTVSAGTVKVNGSITSNVNISSPGILSGSGAVTGNVTVTGGKVIPGGSIGTMTINGNYSPNNTSTLEIELSPSTASKLVVNGTATLTGGTLALVYDSGTYQSATFDILTATSLSGTFGTVTETSKPSNVTSSVNYLANKVQLVLNVASASLAQTATTGLGVIIGTFMDNVAAGSPTTQQQQLLDALNDFTNPNDLNTALSQIAPLSAQPIQSRNIHVMQQQQTSTRLSALRTSAYLAGDGYATYGVWLQPFYDNAKQKDLGNLLGYKAQIGGLTLGVDREINPQLVMGVAASYAYANQKSLINTTESNINNYLAMLYGTYKFKHSTNLDVLLAGGINNYGNSRVLQVNPVNVTATSSYVGQQYSAQAILSKNLLVGTQRKHKTSEENLSVIPQINANYIYVRTPGYTEQNAGSLGMSANSSTSTVLTLGTGLKLERATIIRTHRMVPEAHALVYYDVKEGSISSNSTFVTGGPALSITSSPGRLTGQFGASFSYYCSERFVVKAEYDLQIKNQYFNNIAFVNIRYMF